MTFRIFVGIVIVRVGCAKLIMLLSKRICRIFTFVLFICNYFSSRNFLLNSRTFQMVPLWKQNKQDNVYQGSYQLINVSLHWINNYEARRQSLSLQTHCANETVAYVCRLKHNLCYVTKCKRLVTRLAFYNGRIILYAK